jgi:hypothetical protein
MDMKIDVDIKEIKTILGSHLENLQHFKLSVFNPLFWISILVLFLILWRLWDIKKSFSFSWVIATILLVSSYAEGFIAGLIIKYGGTFDPFFFRIIPVVIICFILLYYIFIK